MRIPWNVLAARRSGALTVVGLAAILAGAGCAAQNARFYTELPQPGSLAAGSPVYNLGTSIGSVASVNRLADGNAGVAFDVDPKDAVAIRRSSIMVVRDDPGGASLDVMTTDPLSPPASPGTQIDGASNQNAANSLVAAKNLAATAPAMAMMMTAPATNAATANTSSAWLALQQQILALQTQMLIAGTAGTAAAAQQLAQINQSATTLEQEMIAAGNSPEAEQLRRQIDALSHTLAMPLPGTIPPTGAAPPIGTAPPAGAPPPAWSASSYGTAGTPPAASSSPYGAAGAAPPSPPPAGTPSASGSTSPPGTVVIPPSS
jgi:hypothetical protein